MILVAHFSEDKSMVRAIAGAENRRRGNGGHPWGARCHGGGGLDVGAAPPQAWMTLLLRRRKHV